MKPLISPRYCNLLTRHGLDTFESFWDLPRHWVEDFNQRRNGWSGAIWHAVVDGEGHRFSMFVKLQENHNYRSPAHLLQWRPTFYRCLLNTRRLKRIGVPTAEPVFYAERREGDRLQAVLVTAALEGYRELNSVFEDSSLAAGVRRAILHRIADLAWLLHCHRLQHNALSGKHLMIKLEKEEAFDLRILDLEKMRRSWSWLRTAVCDLEKLILLTPTLTTVEHAELIGHYASYLSPAYRRKLVMTMNEWIARRRTARSGGVPEIRLIDSCDGPKQKADQTPAFWHFHFPPLLKYSLKKHHIPQTTDLPTKDSTFLE